LVEQRTENPRVVGSIPTLGTILLADIIQRQAPTVGPLRLRC
jgi:hypothetical protein